VAGFEVQHRVAAAAGDASCGRCHTPSSCASCHDGARRPSAFHPADYVQRHGQAALTGDTECSSCHQVQAFCAACHRRQGMTPVGAPYGTFHDASGVWFLGHGAAARRSLEACTTCHTQQFCMRCHSARGAMRVNPHGPGFSPSMGGKNPAMCALCHVGGAAGR
jgi:hypothetical protein